MKAKVEVKKRKGFLGYWIDGVHYATGVHEIELTPERLASLSLEAAVSVEVASEKQEAPAEVKEKKSKKE